MDSYYKPLRGLKGVQMSADFRKFCFSWESAGNDSRIHFLWIYKEDELNNQRMFSYAQCINNNVQVTFQYNNVPMLEVRKIRFLVFLSEEQRAPSIQDLNKLSQRPEYICEVCCGFGKVEWKWVSAQASKTLVINSNKKIPENILYYEYSYENKNFQFDIPGEINVGENVYKNIYFPGLNIIPILKSKESNIAVSAMSGRAGKNSGIFGKIADVLFKR